MNLRVVLILLFMCTANGPAHASQRLCVRTQLAPAEERALRKVITEAAGQREVQWPSMSACVDRRQASTYVRLQSEPQLDGSLKNFSLDCNRGVSKWICDLHQSRSAKVEMDVGGFSRVFDIHLPEGFDFKRVKPLLARAIEVRPKTTVEQQCGYDPGKPADPYAADLLLGNQKTFRFYPTEIYGDILESDGEVSLFVFDEALTFVQDPNDATDVVFRCWAPLVVVS